MNEKFKQDCISILDERMRSGAIDRRTVLSSLILLGILPAVGSLSAKAADRNLVVANWGGDAVKAFQTAFADGFTKAGGLPVKIDGSGPSKGAIQAQFNSGAVRWDVCDAEPGEMQSLGTSGIVEKIDYSVVDKSKVERGFSWEYCVANYFFSYVIAYDAKKFGDNPPKSCADFWDVKKYPGKRTLYKWMSGVLEAALMADGVSMDKLYPLDQDRAFAKLAEIKPHVVSFWDTGAESQQLMRDGEASMGLLWHTRANLVEQDTNGAVRWTYDQGFMCPSAWTVIKGNPAGRKAAMEFIAFCQNPDNQAALLAALGCGPVNPAAHALVSKELRRLDCSLPEHRAVQVAMNTDWYAMYSDGALDRFQAFVSS